MLETLHQTERRLWKPALRLAVVVAPLIILFLVVYLLPYFTGVRFAQALQGNNVLESRALICEGVVSGVLNVLDDASQALTNLVQLPTIGDIPLEDLDLIASYNVLSSEFTFRYALRRDANVAGFEANAGVSSPDVKIIIQRNSPFAPCVVL